MSVMLQDDGRGTYTRPSAISPHIANFFVRDTCTFHSMKIGRLVQMRSVSMANATIDQFGIYGRGYGHTALQVSNVQVNIRAPASALDFGVPELLQRSTLCKENYYRGAIDYKESDDQHVE